MHKYRRNYWSCGSFASFLNKKYCVEKPSAATGQGWIDWNSAAKSKSKLVYWFTETFLDNLQDIILFPLDVLYTIKIYLMNRFISKTHVLQTKLEVGKWYDLDTRLLHACFESLVDFVEIEKGAMQVEPYHTKTSFIKKLFSFKKRYRNIETGLEYLKWESTLEYDGVLSNQAKNAIEVKKLYDWWKVERPARKDIFEGEYEKTFESFGIFNHESKTDEEKLAYRNYLDEVNKKEAEYNLEDEENLIRLIKLRGGLWT